ncbi:FtsK/SpoIIIE domain-containing protein [Microbacterium hydrocarbonoxydans]|uniref:FtsK/SpoIIIE domain-containing protein n=1 Tax=Microbacterium hydrocarbonoxydans TaxID=273678 RepID=UPI00203B91E2|nr:FtsK/SpoIIIE domain-containing protein [Microbacterium hydrocarbonoxydans]MCM3779182.1 FtsK/SpoIIIE domain-containing protein [Microbacterium hydrocarbonoxydans]
MDSLPISLPASPTTPPKQSIPFLAALVPVGAGVVLWLVTGSVYSLCFAALGPLMIGASLIEGRRSRRKATAQAEAVWENGWHRAEEELAERQADERTRRWHREPDVAAAVLTPPLRTSATLHASTTIVVGAGTRPSSLRASGDDGERAREFRRRCAVIDHVPVAVPIGAGLAVRGDLVIAAAMVRALVVQLSLRFGTAQLAVVGEAVARVGLATLPQATSAGRGAFRLGIIAATDGRPDADAVVWMLASDEPVPDGVAAVVDLDGWGRASLRTPDGVIGMAPEYLSVEQAAAIGSSLIVDDGPGEEIPEAVAFADLEQIRALHGLPAVIGLDRRGGVVVDLVEDGPHAVVTGTTGSGKSELLITWVTAIAARHGPDEMVFVLADFKGGTAFDSLRTLPQVAAVITDLDGRGAVRGVASLTAELRRREEVLAHAGARDIRDVQMPRLVIVIDEYAALLQEHPELAAVFTDIAARGRALGMHLVLGTQRATGVVRDALAANCPLRVSLRVSEAADSRAVIGTDDAARITGGPDARGLAFVRRPSDDIPVPLRVAQTTSDDIARIGDSWRTATPSRSPWLPALPAVVPLAEIEAEVPAGAIVLGRADVPAHQAQPLELLRPGVERGVAVIGQSGSGRTAVLRALARQCADVTWVPADPEGAWDAVTGLVESPSARPSLILCDDIDAVHGALPSEYAVAFLQMWERLLRGDAGTSVALSASRWGGPATRVLELLPRRVVLQLPSRADHVAAGGDASTFERDRPPGRALIDGREVQVAWTPEQPLHASSRRRMARSVRSWAPSRPLTAVVTAGAAAVVETLHLSFPDARVVRAEDVASASEMGREGIPWILVDEADVWQRQRMLWHRLREEGEILVRAENAPELRHLVGVRDLPPYALVHAGRVWSVIGAERPRRLVLDALVL